MPHSVAVFPGRQGRRHLPRKRRKLYLCMALSDCNLKDFFFKQFDKRMRNSLREVTLIFASLIIPCENRHWPDLHFNETTVTKNNGPNLKKSRYLYCILYNDAKIVQVLFFINILEYFRYKMWKVFCMVKLWTILITCFLGLIFSVKAAYNTSTTQYFAFFVTHLGLVIQKSKYLK